MNFTIGRRDLNYKAREKTVEPHLNNFIFILLLRMLLILTNIRIYCTAILWFSEWILSNFLHNKIESIYTI